MRALAEASPLTLPSPPAAAAGGEGWVRGEIHYSQCGEKNEMHVLITAGPTREYIDDVRFLSNASSGRMGYTLAHAARQRGWHVTLVSGPVSMQAPAGVDLRPVTSAQEMLDACLHAL